MFYISRTEFLVASFFDTFYIQRIFYDKPRSQLLRSIIEYLFHRGPPLQGFIGKLVLHTVKKNVDGNLNGKQNLSPEKGICSYLVNFYRTIDAVYEEYTVFLKNYFVYGYERSTCIGGRSTWRVLGGYITWNKISDTPRSLSTLSAFKKAVRQLRF